MKTALLVAGTAALLASSLTLAETGLAGSSKASTQVSCVNGTVQKNQNNWITACTLDRDQTFTRRSPAGATTEVRCMGKRSAAWDQYGWLTRCTPVRPGNKNGNQDTMIKLDEELPQ